MLTPTQIDAIVKHACKHAADEYPFECCGLIDQAGTPHRCVNIAKDRKTGFRINETDAARITRSGTIAGVYHSHVDEKAYLSKADRDGFTANGLHVVISCVGGLCQAAQIWWHDNGQLCRVIR